MSISRERSQKFDICSDRAHNSRPAMPTSVDVTYRPLASERMALSVQADDPRKVLCVARNQLQTVGDSGDGDLHVRIG